jgi:DNA-binding transcriptional LysR family regulator
MLFLAPLRAFFEAARSGSIRKAGESLGLAPSTVSRQILVLESQIGTALFDRSVSGVVPTHAGELVADYARRVLLDYGSLRADLNDLRGIRRQLVRIATVEGAVSGSAVAAIVAFQAKFDEIEFQIKIVPATEVPEVIKAGEADVGVTFCGEPDAELNVEVQIRDPIVLAVPPDHNLAAASSIPLADLRGVKLAMPGPKFGIRRLLDQACHAQGYVLTPTLSTNSFAALRAFVCQGAGAAVLTRLSVAADERQNLMKSILIDVSNLQNTTIDIITLKTRQSSILKLFLAELRGVMKAIA